MEFADRFKLLRTENKLKQTDISKIFGLSVRQIQNYEWNKQTPDFKTLIAIADYFDVSLDYLVGRSDERDYTPSNERILDES